MAALGYAVPQGTCGYPTIDTALRKPECPYLAYQECGLLFGRHADQFHNVWML